MHSIQADIIQFIREDGLNDYFLNDKNLWMIISGGYEVQLTAYLYHSFGGIHKPNLYYETTMCNNDGSRISVGLKKKPDMIISGIPGQVNKRLVIAKDNLSVYTNIPILSFIEYGHDFANKVDNHINKIRKDFKAIKGALDKFEATANGILHIQYATEYIHISESFSRYINPRGKINTNRNLLDKISESIAYIQCTEPHTYNIHNHHGLQLKVHVFFAYQEF